MGMVKKVEILRLRTLELLLNVRSFSKVHPLALALPKFMDHTHTEVWIPKSRKPGTDSLSLAPTKFTDYRGINHRP
jgi:hypothetical protein